MLASSDQAMNTRQQPRSNSEQPPNCPRCASTNTKFCYYNNYSLTQPRYFCKGCKRYWTMGGSLRNVPAGSGYRRRRRSRPSKAHSSSQPSDHDQDSPYSNNSSSDSCSSTVEIDLAAVFANYLNQDPGPRIQPVSNPDPGLMGLLENTIWSTSQNCTSSDLSTDFTDWDPIVDLKELDSSPIEPRSVFMADEFQSTEIDQVMSDINWSFFDLEDTRALLELDS